MNFFPGKENVVFSCVLNGFPPEMPLFCRTAERDEGRRRARRERLCMEVIGKCFLTLSKSISKFSCNHRVRVTFPFFGKYVCFLYIDINVSLVIDTMYVKLCLFSNLLTVLQSCDVQAHYNFHF